MSKGSQQQPTTSRDRGPSAASRAKQPAKGDGNTNGAHTNGAHSNGAKAVPPPVPSKKAPTDDVAQNIAVIPSESAEDDFFARGDEVNSSFPPAAMDVLEPELDDRPEVKPLTPAQLERRARLRRIVGSVVGAAAVMTAVVGAKALSAPPTKVSASDGSLNVPHHVVPSIALAPQQEEPAAPKVAATEPAPAAEQAAPAGDKAPAAENAAAQGNAEPAAKPAAETAAAEPPPAPAKRRLPVIDVEIPASTDPAVDKQWESAAKNLTSQDFKGADSAFAELGKRADPATRETARLARAVWWTANGRQNEVKPVIADLAANATTPSVRQHAQQLLHAD